MGLAKRIIPCLDVDNGRVVKGIKFVDIRDAGNPVEVAKRYDEQGADEITFLDITATHEKRGIMIDVVRRTAECVFMPVTVGGGLRTVDDIDAMLRAGADKISLNSAAISNPKFITEASLRFGAQCIVIAIDARRRSENLSDGWEVFTHLAGSDLQGANRKRALPSGKGRFRTGSGFRILSDYHDGGGQPAIRQNEPAHGCAGACDARVG